MIEISDNIFQLSSWPRNSINAYLVGDVLFDAGTRPMTNRILKELSGHSLSLHVLTHVHADHNGASKAVCETFGIPLWCGEQDLEAMETGKMDAQIPRNVITRLQLRFWLGPPHKVDRGLKEGDEVAGFRVVEIPGHSPGHIAFWREADGTLIAGDALTNMNVITGRPGLHEPLGIFTPDRMQNRDSLRKLASLEPKQVLFGHGPPLMEGHRFVEFVAALPDSKA
jgi:hydroxyacylglutathione hydrolase